MKNLKIKLKKASIIFFTLIFIFSNLGYSQAIEPLKEEPAAGNNTEDRVDNPALPDRVRAPEGDKFQEPKELNYVPGELIVKLKEGKTLEDIQELNTKYNVTSSEKVFKDIPSPEDTLKKLKNKLAGFELEHQKWYWQLDKDSQEYKDYLAKMEKEKEQLQQQIQFQEELITRLEERQKGAPEGESTTPVHLENIYQLETSPETNIQEMAAEYKDNPSVEYAEPKYIRRLFTGEKYIPNDPLYPQQWAHKNTQAEQGWAITRGSPNVVVAIIDSGVWYNHPDLKDNIWHDIYGNPGKDFVDIDIEEWKKYGYEPVEGEDYAGEDNDPNDFNGHGTHCAGIVAARNNDIGVIGVSPECKIMPLRAGFSLKYKGRYAGVLDPNAVVNAIKYATDNGANVISMSFGGPGFSALEKNALEYAYDKHVVLVAAAGNDSTTTMSYPAAYDGVISVAASEPDNTRAWYSNFGYWIDVAAPGSEILSTVPLAGVLISDPSGYKRASGTSMACPYVAGLAALIISNYPDLSNRQVENLLRITADPPISDIYIGVGIINVKEAVSRNSVSSAIARIENPAPNSKFFKREVVGIMGPATGDRYIVEYGRGAYPNQWIQIGSGTRRVGGLLAGWDLSMLPDGFDAYVIRLKVFDTAGEVVDITPAYVLFDKDFQQGWPKVTEDILSAYCSPIVEDMDGDGLKEIILSGGFARGDTTFYPYGRIHILKHNGAYLNGGPITGFLGIPEQPPSVGDINGDGKPEIVISANRKKSDGDKTVGGLYVYSNEGNLIWEKKFDEGNDSYIFGSTIADIDKVGFKDIILKTSPSNTVHALEGNGKELWNKQVEGYMGESNAPFCIGDLDGDKIPEIVFSTINAIGDPLTIVDTNLYVLNNKGGEVCRQTWPLEKISGVILADMDDDMKLEVVFSMSPSDISGPNPQSFLYYLDYSDTGFGLKLIKTLDQHENYIAIGDLNKDSKLEIILTGATPGGSTITYFSRQVSAVDIDGNEVFKRIFPEMDGIEAPAVGDIDGDSYPDVVFSVRGLYKGVYRSNLYCLDRNGNILSGFPKSLMSWTPSFAAPPAISDLDNDGDVEIVLHDMEGMIYVWDLGGSYDPNTMFWPMFQHDPQHTGQYSHVVVAPQAPTGLPADSVVTQNSVTIHWADNSDNEKGFIIRRSPPEPALERRVERNIVTFTDTPLTPKTAYTYQVSAYNAAGESTPCFLTVATLAVTKPGVPTGVTAIAGDRQATVSFTAPSSNGGSAILDYTVTSTSGSKTATGTASPITVTGLTNGTAYTFTVTARNAIGTSSASGASNSVTPATVPDAPTISRVTIGDKQATVYFTTTPASDGGSPITSYTVTSDPASSIPDSGKGSASPITVTGLTNGTPYTFTVTATNKIGTGRASNPSDSVTLATVPGKPTPDIADFVTPNSVTINWIDNSDNEDGFIIRRSLPEPALEIGRVERNIVTFTDTPVTLNTRYDYQVSAYNVAGESNPCTLSVTTPAATAPAAPVFDAIDDQSVTEGQLLQFTISAHDPNVGDTLTYSCSNPPDGANFDATTKTFTWTPDHTQVGKHTVRFQVSDGSLTDYKDIIITVKDVAPPNQAPEITVLTVPPTGSVGSELTFSVTATDEDPSTLKYSWDFGDGSSISGQSVSHTYNNIGTYTVKVTVTDKEGLSAEETSSSITITQPSQAPQTYTITASAGAHGSIDPVGSVSKIAGESQTFTATPADATYTVDQWQVEDIVVQTGGNTYTLNDIQSNHWVNVTFKLIPPQTYIITASAGANGSVSPSSISKTQGESQTFTATPNTNYTVDQWKLDGSLVQTGGNTYTLTSIQANQSVSVTFKAIPPKANQAPTVTSVTGPASGYTGKPYTYTFTAIGASDSDGRVVTYEFSLSDVALNDVVRYTGSSSSVSFVFGDTGNRVIKVRVKDNEGAWSGYVSCSILVERPK